MFRKTGFLIINNKKCILQKMLEVVSNLLQPEIRPFKTFIATLWKIFSRCSSKNLFTTLVSLSTVIDFAEYTSFGVKTHNKI